MYESREEFLSKRAYERNMEMAADLHEIRQILERLHPTLTTSHMIEQRNLRHKARDEYWINYVDALGMRAFNILTNNDWATSIEAVSALTDEDLLRAHNLGHGALDRIRRIAPYKEVTK